MKGDTGNIVLLAGQKLKLTTGPANYFYVYDATGLLAISLLRSSQVQERHVAGRLTMLPGKEYDQVEIENISGAENTIRILYGPGLYEPPTDRSEVNINDTDPVRIQVISGGFTVDTVVEPSNIVGVGADITVGSTATLIAAADATRKEIMLELDVDAAAPVRIGDSGVTAATGYRLQPGATIVLAQAGAIYAIRTGSEDETLSYIIGKRV